METQGHIGDEAKSRGEEEIAKLIRGMWEFSLFSTICKTYDRIWRKNRRIIWHDPKSRDVKYGLFGGALDSEKQLFGSQLLRIWKSSETQLLQLLAS